MQEQQDSERPDRLTEITDKLRREIAAHVVTPEQVRDLLCVAPPQITYGHR